MSAEEVAAAFVNHYYTTFETDPMALAGLYQPASTLTFEGKTFQGAQAIIERFAVRLILSVNLLIIRP